jgi:hypothetical protein
MADNGLESVTTSERPSNPAMAWIMGISAAMITTLLFGSYLYTYFGDSENIREKTEWRRAHEVSHKEEIKTLREGQDKISDKMDAHYEKLQGRLDDVLMQTRQIKQQNRGQ